MTHHIIVRGEYEPIDIFSFKLARHFKRVTVSNKRLYVDLIKCRDTRLK